MRNPTPADFHLLQQVREIMRMMVLPLEGEAMITEAVVRQVAFEEGLSKEDTAFLVVLALGEATEDNWQDLILPF